MQTLRRFAFVVATIVVLVCCGEGDKTTTPTGVPQKGQLDREGSTGIISSDVEEKEICLDGRDPDARTNWCGGYYIFGNPYPCCCNNANCTWWAWYAAKMVWGISLPPWGNVASWAGAADSNKEIGVTVHHSPAVHTIGVNTKATLIAQNPRFVLNEGEDL